MNKIIAIISFLLILSCSAVQTNATYDITCYVQQDSLEEKVILNDVVGYAFSADTAVYAPRSYTQAVEGTVESSDGQKQLSPIQTASFDQTLGLAQFHNLSEGLYIFVLCDTQNEIYSYRQFNVTVGLGDVVTYLDFLLYKFISNPTAEITENKWLQQK